MTRRYSPVPVFAQLADDGTFSHFTYGNQVFVADGGADYAASVGGESAVVELPEDRSYRSVRIDGSPSNMFVVNFPSTDKPVSQQPCSVTFTNDTGRLMRVVHGFGIFDVGPFATVVVLAYYAPGSAVCRLWYIGEEI